jgi:hypothetical protein
MPSPVREPVADPAVALAVPDVQVAHVIAAEDGIAARMSANAQIGKVKKRRRDLIILFVRSIWEASDLSIIP